MSEPAHLIPLPTIIDGLNGRIEELCRTLLPGGRRDGAEWRCGSLGGEKGKSLGVHLRGAKAGVWADFASGEGGDALDLVAATRFAGNKSDAVKWAKSWLGYGGDETRLKQTRRKAEAKKKESDSDPTPAQKRGAAQSLWLSAQKEILGTPVDHYLAGRGIELSRLPKVPGALRFHPACFDAGTGHKHPAMLAAVNDAQGFLTVHRTYLRQLPGGRVVKADMPAPKKVYSSYRGGTIRLARGVSNKGLGRMPAGEAIYLTEGIEDALVIAQEVPEWRVLAMIAITNLTSIALPEQAGKIVVCADNDAPGSKAHQALDKGMQSLLRRGFEVQLALPPEGHKDWNDYYLAMRANKQGGAA